MKLRNRLSLVLFGIIVFVVATPILVLYARGYQWDWNLHQFIKTGALVMKTDPAKATVFLNDIKQASTTPLSIRFLAPGDYAVRVEKDGYFPWSKRLSVKSQLVTWANADRDSLALFLVSPKLEQTWETETAQLSKSADEIVFTAADQAEVINANNASLAQLGSVKELKLPVLPNTAGLEWENAKQIFSKLVNIAKWNLTAAQESQVQNAVTDGQHVVLRINSILYTADDGNLNLVDTDVSTLSLTSDGIWYVQKNKIKHYNFTNPPETFFDNLPAAAAAQIIRTPNQVYVILDQTLYLVNGAMEKIYSPVTQAAWDASSSLLTYGNDNEIYLYHPETKNSSLVLRSQTPIKNPALNLATGYMFFQNENKIKAIELDSRDHQNIYTLADAQNEFAVSTDGKKLFTISGNKINYYTIR